MTGENTVLTRFFSQNMLKNFLTADECSSSLMQRIVRKYCIPVEDGATNEKVISDIYRYIGKSYRNEYFYKNTLLNKLIINVHRVRTTTALTEVPIARSKADFIMINGKAVVYEIKTELDTFERLKTQLADYYRAFDHVCVVTSETQLPLLKEKLSNSPVGIYVLTDRNTIKRIKEPEIYREALDSSIMFKILNKPEYEMLVRQVNGSLPDVTQVRSYQACKEILCNIPVDQLYDMLLRQLKKRTRISIDYRSVPDALHFLLYFSKAPKEDTKKLAEFLSAQFKGG